MTPQQVILLIYILYGIIAALSLILVFIVWKTPALTFLKASLLKLPVIYIMGKDHLSFFKTFRPKHGSAVVRRIGIFHLTENSHTLEAGSKIPIYFAFRDLAATLLPEYPAIIQELREDGFKITNLEDLSAYIAKFKEQITQDYPVKVHAYKTYKLHDLANMFPYNLDPTFIDATVQCEVSKFIKIMKMAPMAIGGVIALVMVGALAFYIINMAFKGKIDAKDCVNMVNAAKCAASNIQILNATVF